MNTVKIKDKTFKLSVPEAEIMKSIQIVANQLNRDYEGKEPLLLSVLNGSFMFAADLIRMLRMPCEISFVKMSSYEGTSTMGAVKQLIGLNQDIAGRDVIIVEDIVESGITMAEMIKLLNEKHPASVRVCTLLQKPNCLRIPLTVDYVAMKIPDDFIVGYGLDYDQGGRNLRDIYTVVE
jgi:hypoxanthine phosphoribosyltransferase